MCSAPSFYAPTLSARFSPGQGGNRFMNYLTIDELQDCLKPMGRTLTDPQSGVLYFDWTLSGVEILFRGCTLMADLCALPGTEADRSP